MRGLNVALMMGLVGGLWGYGIEEIPGWPFEASTFTRVEDTLRDLVLVGFGGGVVVGRVNPVDSTFEVISDRIRAGGLVVDLSYDPVRQKLAAAVVPDQVEIWDVSDPTEPVRERVIKVGRCFRVGSRTIEDWGGVALGDGWLLVACGDRGLLGVDWRSSFPVPVAIFPGVFWDVDRWRKDRVLVAGHRIFAVLDVTDWRHPVAVDSVVMGGVRITPGGNWAAVGRWGMDLRDPEHIRVACNFASGSFPIESQTVAGGTWEDGVLWVAGWDWVRGYVCEDTGRVVMEINLPDSAHALGRMVVRTRQGLAVFSPPGRHGSTFSLPFVLWVPSSRDTAVWLGGYRIPGYGFRMDRLGRWYALADGPGGVRVFREENGELVEVPTPDVFPVHEVVWVDSTLLLAAHGWYGAPVWVLAREGNHFTVLDTLRRRCMWMVSVGDGKHVVCEFAPVGWRHEFFLLDFQDPSGPVVEDSMIGEVLYGDMKRWKRGDREWIYVVAGRFDPFNMAGTRDYFSVLMGSYGTFAFGNGWFVTGFETPAMVFVYSLTASGVPGAAEAVLNNPNPPQFEIYSLPWDMEFVGPLLFLPCATRWGSTGLCAYDFAGMPDPPKVLEQEVGDYFYDLEVFGDTLVVAGVGLRRFRVIGLPVEEGNPARHLPRLRVEPFPGGIRLEGDPSGVRVVVMDVLGRKVHRVRVDGVRRLLLPRGVYVLQVQERGEPYVRKILVP